MNNIALLDGVIATPAWTQVVERRRMPKPSDSEAISVLLFASG